MDRFEASHEQVRTQGFVVACDSYLGLVRSEERGAGGGIVIMFLAAQALSFYSAGLFWKCEVNAQHELYCH